MQRPLEKKYYLLSTYYAPPRRLFEHKVTDGESQNPRGLPPPNKALTDVSMIMEVCYICTVHQSSRQLGVAI